MLSATNIVQRALNKRVRERLRVQEHAKATARTRTAEELKARRAAWRECKRLFAAGDHSGSFRVFCEQLVEITTKVPGEVIPFTLNEIQRRFVAARTGRDVILKARQVGATTLEVARDVWFALMRTNVAVGIVTIPDKANLYVKGMQAKLAFLLDGLADLDVVPHWSGLTARFDNGSTITVFDSGGTEHVAERRGRSGTFHRLHLTESAFYPFDAATVVALMKTLPSIEQGGEYTEESTANGAGGLFYEHCEGAAAATNGLTLHFYPWFLQSEYHQGLDASAAQDPRDGDEAELIAAARELGIEFTVAQLTWWRTQRSLNGIDRTLQEYPHDRRRAFIQPGTTYFDVGALDRLEKCCADALRAHDTLAPLVAKLNRDEPALRVWEEPIAHEEYLISVDTAGGKKRKRSNWLVANVYRRSDKAHVATYREKRQPSEFARRCAELGIAYNKALLVVERNNHGHSVLVVLEEQEHYPNVWYAPDGLPGWYTGPHNRTAIIDALVDAVTRGEYSTRDRVFVSEARTFIRHEDGSVAARDGCDDDTIMASAIGLRVLTMPRDYVGDLDHNPMDDH